MHQAKPSSFNFLKWWFIIAKRRSSGKAHRARYCPSWLYTGGACIIYSYYCCMHCILKGGLKSPQFVPLSEKDALVKLTVQLLHLSSESLILSFLQKLSYKINASIRMCGLSYRRSCSSLCFSIDTFAYQLRKSREEWTDTQHTYQMTQRQKTKQLAEEAQYRMVMKKFHSSP